MSNTPIKIAIFGLGTVGGSTYQILTNQKELIERRTGFPVEVAKVCELNEARVKELGIDSSRVTQNADDILNDDSIHVIVELIGDRPIAKEVMSQALAKGKHVVTANKAILAKHGDELFKQASEANLDLFFEAAVAGAIPVIRSVREGFVGEQVESILGIINGTANYILSAMSEKGAAFNDVLKEAQESGFAEADPTADIEGMDSAHKLTILTALTYGQMIALDDVYTEGITSITALDIEMAKKLGYQIKLLAISKQRGDQIEARVHPTMITQDHMLANVSGAFNALMIDGPHLGPSLLYGLGAGGFPTATAVVGDVIEIARSVHDKAPGAPALGFLMNQMQKGQVKPMDEIESEYYLRFTAIDEPGVFANIAKTLGENHISISSVHQHGREEGSKVPIVVLTHRAKESDVRAALNTIDAFESVSDKTMLIRVES